MRKNFMCSKCKRLVTVGKHLHSSYTCPLCHNQMVISRKERQNGKLDYKNNFFLSR